MTDVTETSSQRDRSPAYPNVPLETALQRLTEFEAHFKRSPARPEKIGDAWGIKTKAYADRIAAALRYFGLLEYQGAGTGRHVVVSDEGRKYLRAQQEETKREVIVAAAIRPKQLAKFWNDWGRDRPVDAACLDDLVLKNGFSQSGAREFLNVYDATISFARLADSDKSEDAVQKTDGEKIPFPNVKVGDLVQFEINGALQLERATRVRAIQEHEGHKWVFIEGSETGIPMEQVIVEQKSGAAPQGGIMPPRLPEAKRELNPGTKEEKNSLDEGEAILIWPENLSKDSVRDLEYWLKGVLRKAKRRAGIKDDEAAH